MKNRLLMVMLAVLVVAGAACSARTQLAMEETKKNGAHFATWNHMGYSVNRGTPSRPRRAMSRYPRPTPASEPEVRVVGEPVLVQPIQ